MRLPLLLPDRPVLIAGPTASGKSDLALEIAERHGGVIVNADASQVYDCWRVVTARPSHAEEARAPHRLYGHVPWDAPYSVGHWLREVMSVLSGPERAIIVGGTGLYFKALTQGMAQIPPIPEAIRQEADATSLETMRATLDPETASQIDLMNRARVQRAWEVLTATGRGLAQWQAETPAPLLPLANVTPIAVHAPKDWLNARIIDRFDRMIALGALDEVAAMAPHYDPSKPAFKAIGVPELMDHVMGRTTLDDARESASIATRQYAKRQRTWIRSQMANWFAFHPELI